MTEFKLSFLEYGKYFESNRTSDFFDLAYTEDMAGRSKSLRDALSVPDSRMTPFRFVEGQKRVTAAFLPYANGWFFARVQARREDEGPSKNMMRPFYQIRFTHLDAFVLQNVFSTGEYGFWSIFFAGAPTDYEPFYTEIKGVVEPQLLKDGKNELQLLIKEMFQSQLFKDEYVYDSFLQVFSQSKLILAIVSSLSKLLEKESSREKVQLRIIYDEKNKPIELRLLLLDVVQRMVYPKFGWVSFALDYVSSPLGTPPRIQFLSRTDAKTVPAPVNVMKENIIEIDISDEKSYRDLVESSYTRAVTAFIQTEIDMLQELKKARSSAKFSLHEDLFSRELTDLVAKYDIGGFDRFLMRHRILVNPNPYYWLSMNEKDFDEILDELAAESVLRLYNVLKDISHPRTFKVVVLMEHKQINGAKEAFSDILRIYAGEYLAYGV